ncbi:MAG TPA: cbb3-type cytochrome c oxidase subunit 3 [Nevskiaceae bacterium]|nr:cbb3-type cytochrome c oxidase subunit 3 [Nevskiaceae bacterium]
MSSGIVTLVAFISFLGIVVWAYSRRNRGRFHAASRLPLEDETSPCCEKPGVER